MQLIYTLVLAALSALLIVIGIFNRKIFSQTKLIEKKLDSNNMEDAIRAAQSYQLLHSIQDELRKNKGK